MSSKLSIKSMLESDTLIYVAPILIIVALFHIFDASALTHKFGQLEMMGAVAIACYYLWDKIAVVYDPAIIGKKRIEAVACIVVGIFSALTFMPVLLTWQFYNLRRASDRYSLNNHIMVAVVSVWVAVGVLFFSSYTIAKQKIDSSNSTIQESSMPEAPTQ